MLNDYSSLDISDGILAVSACLSIPVPYCTISTLMYYAITSTTIFLKAPLPGKLNTEEPETIYKMTVRRFTSTK